MTIQTLVVGVDGSDGTASAVRFAATLARQLGASVIAVHAYEPLEHLEEIRPGVDLVEVRNRVRAEMTDRWCEPLVTADVSFTVYLDEGAPSDLLLGAAVEHDADLILVGARRLGWFRQLALGSTSADVLRNAHVPVVVVHPDGERATSH